MRDLFSSMPSNELGQTLSRADYHGAIFNVYQSRCPSYVGIQGIMIQETLNTFVLIRNNDSRFATIPKKGTIFSVYLRLNPETQDTTEWQLCGDQLIGHSGLRSAKKFKSRGAVNL